MNLPQQLKQRALLAKLQSEDMAQVIEAADALTEFKDLRVVNQLLEVLSLNERHPARQAAARALGRIEERASVPGLIAALDDPEDYVRIEVIRALARLRDPEAVPRLAAMLRSDDEKVREEAVQALVVFGPAATEWLVVILRREAFFSRQAAAKALGLLGGETAANALLSALSDTDYLVRCEVVEALARLGRLAGEPLRELVSDPRVEVRLAAIKTLTRIRDAQAFRELERATQDGIVEVREAAWHALAILDWPPARKREEIMRRLKFGDFARAAGAGAEALEPLIEAFRAGDRATRDQVGEAVRLMGPPACEGLVRALKDLDLDVRQFAARLLGELGWKPADAGERILVGIATGRFGEAVAEGAAAIEPLCEALRRQAEPGRVLAARSLGEIGDVRAVEPLVTALADEEFKVRETAAIALGRLGGGIALEALRQAALDRHYNVASAARTALKKLGEES
jgi:HEAT repeat protein